MGRGSMTTRDERSSLRGRVVSEGAGDTAVATRNSSVNMLLKLEENQRARTAGRPGLDPYYRRSVNAINFLSAVQGELRHDTKELVADALEKAEADLEEASTSLFSGTSPAMQAALNQTTASQTQLAAESYLEEDAALEFYCGVGWRELNPHLCYQSQLSDAAEVHKQNLEDLFAKLPGLPTSLIASRAVDGSEASEFGGSPEALRELYKAETLTDPGYISTSAKLVHLGPSAGQTSLLIELPEGSKALAVPAFKPWDADLELILPPNSTLKLKQRIENEDGGVTVLAELQ